MGRGSQHQFDHSPARLIYGRRTHQYDDVRRLAVGSDLEDTDIWRLATFGADYLPSVGLFSKLRGLATREHPTLRTPPRNMMIAITDVPHLAGRFAVAVTHGESVEHSDEGEGPFDKHGTFNELDRALTYFNRPRWKVDLPVPVSRLAVEREAQRAAQQRLHRLDT